MVRVWVNGFGLGFRVLVWFGQGRERGKGGGAVGGQGRERGVRPRERKRGGSAGPLVAGGSQGERGEGAAKKSKRERERDLQEKLKRKQGNEKREFGQGGGAASTGREREVIFGLVIIRVSYFFF